MPLCTGSGPRFVVQVLHQNASRLGSGGHPLYRLAHDDPGLRRAYRPQASHFGIGRLLRCAVEAAQFGEVFFGVASRRRLIAPAD